MRTSWVALVVLSLSSAGAAAGTQSPANQLAVVVDALMLPAGSDGSYADWRSIESVKQIQWQPLPPTMLDNALPDGSYFTRKGLANLAGQPFGVVATGARTMVMNIYFRNVSATPVGEAAVLDALQGHGFSLELARCPVKGAAGAGNSWWRIKVPKKDPAWFYSQIDCKGKKCEGYALLLGQSLPTLTPQEQHLYTDHCTGKDAGSAAAPVAAWDMQLAKLFISMMPSAPAATLPWTEIDKASGVTWAPMPPLEMPSPVWSDTDHHFYRGGQTDLGGRVMYLTATGTRDAVHDVHLEDQSPLANRGDVLTALRSDGFKVQLVRCGKIYQLSSSSWYSVAGPGKHAAMLMRSVRCDTVACPKGQESYTLAIDGVLPKLQAGEVAAVAGSCPGR